MGGSGAQVAEIVRGRHDAFAEVVLPDTIDEDTSGQWMVRPRQPARPGRAEAARLRSRWGCRETRRFLSIRQHGKNARLHLGARCREVAAAEHIGGWRLARLPGCLNLAERLPPTVQCRDFLFECGDSSVILIEDGRNPLLP